MIRLFSTNPVWQLISQSDGMTWFVLIFLLSLSVLCWTIFFYKLIIWKTKRKQLENALLQIRSAKKLEDVINFASKYSNTIPGYFLSKNLATVKAILIEKEMNEGNLSNSQELTNIEWETLQRSVENSIEQILHQEESFMSILFVGYLMSPLMGLFGTVWGIVHAFLDISKKQATDIATVAPGIAEALITTIAGLIVAIPALVMYHSLKLKLASMEQSLVSFADKFLFLSQKLFNKTKHDTFDTTLTTNIKNKDSKVENVFK